jgi:hypothetical protein
MRALAPEVLMDPVQPFPAKGTSVAKATKTQAGFLQGRGPFGRLRAGSVPPSLAKQMSCTIQALVGPRPLASQSFSLIMGTPPRQMVATRAKPPSQVPTIITGP